MIFSEYRNKEQGLADLLNYAHFVDEGIFVNKDGAFLMSFEFRAPDINSATGAELDALTKMINRMVGMLEDGWMIHVDELRIPSLNYPEKNYFPSFVASIIDEERKRLYLSEGAHYENLQYLTFVWKFPLPLIKTTRHWFVEGLPESNDSQDLNKLLQQFKDTVERCIGLLSSCLKFHPLNNHELLAYLNTCITGELLPISVPSDGLFIDTILGRRNLMGGYIPKIGNKHIYVLSIIGYLNQETIPGLLEEMATYPLMYRWSNRFMPLSESTAEAEIKRYQKHWHNKIKGLAGTIKEALFSKTSQKINHDAVEMVEETDLALTSNSNLSTRFGYWTSNVVLIHENQLLILEAIKTLRKYLEQKGFSCVIEEVNTLDAWLGSIPGHGSCNVRRVFLNSLNLAHVLPLHTIWTGNSFSSNSSLLPKNSPPVFYAATTGKTPFRFHLDVGDVGHQLVLGPTGSGKSTYLGFLIAQFLRYEHAQIYVFDKDYSHQALTIALEGHHYDIGNAETLAFAPLAELSTETQKVRAAQFIETLVILQNIEMTPEIRKAILDAINNLSENTQANNRNLTVFHSIVQHPDVRSALQFYTLNGQFKLLDANESHLKNSYLNTFEMNWLLSQKPEIYLPVLIYLFDQIEERLEQSQGQYPTLIILEEAWLYVGHEVFAKKLRDWLKTLRKKNARVIFATQSLSDLYDPSTQTLNSITATLLESCPTRVFLPNPKMESEMKLLYQKMGLNEKQLEILSQIAIPKKHYYVVTPEGHRLIELGFNKPYDLALSFIGLSKEKSLRLMECKQNHPDNWMKLWLEENNDRKEHEKK
jgi:type IV secretion/conjugal transfer VirB4 family ATPase